MADRLTTAQRSALMARIRSAGNASTELRLVALLRAGGITGWRRGCRLRLRGQRADGGRRRTDRSVKGQTAGRGLKRRATVGHPCSSAKSVVGTCRPSSAVSHPLTVKPDFVFRSERLVVFVDGCFWHGCPVHFTRPKARRAFWDAKIAANRARDRRVDRALRASGWRVLHVWEHALASRQIARTLARLRRAVGRPAASVAAFLALRYAAGLVDRER
jgi:DNA mismatch endonuclease (patch repair protein)